MPEPEIVNPDAGPILDSAIKFRRDLIVPDIRAFLRTRDVRWLRLAWKNVVRAHTLRRMRALVRKHDRG